MNALVRAYIERNLEFKFMSSKEASDWLGQQLAEQREQVDASAPETCSPRSPKPNASS